MKKGYRFSLLIVIACWVGFLSGCGKSGEKTVATVGDYEITLKEFEDFTNQLRRPFPSAQDEFDEKRRILDTMIIKRLLVQEAYVKGIDQLEEIARVVLANKDKFLLDIMYQREVLDKTEVTEAEMKAFHNKLEYQFRASHVLVDSPDTAEMIVQRALDGESFEQLAYDYSKDPSAQRNRGDLGYFPYGSMVDEFQDAILQMEPGEISPPVKSQFGYHIIKLVDKQLNEGRDEYENMKPVIERQIGERKRQKLTAEFMERLQAEFAVAVDQATVDFVAHKREALYPPQIVETLPRSGFDIEQLDRSERELILATWDGGQITLFEYLTQIEQMPLNLRPDLEDLDSVATIIFRMKMQDFLVLEANRAGLENDPELKRKIRLFKELSMAEIMRGDSLPKPLPPDEAMIRQYYEDNSEKFSEPAKVHVFEILLSDEILANRLAKEIKTLEGFKEKATELTERPAKRGTNGDLDYIERKFFPEIFDLAKKTPDGSIGGPVVTAGGKYSIFWVVDRVEAKLKDYLEIKPQITQMLKAEQQEEIFLNWVDQQKINTDISINDDVLWETIDMEMYASADAEPQVSNP
jgi:peptidyl-prolyl cis-trans isomerase C